MRDVVLKKGKERSLLRRHPWVYDSAVGSVDGKPEVGETVRVVDAGGRFLALAAYAPASGIRARCWAFEPTEIDAAFIKARVKNALLAREALFKKTSAVRVIFGEADGLPGLIVDRYGDFYVAQFLSCGIERFKPAVIEALSQTPGIQGIYERSDAAARTREGLESRTGVLWGEEPPEKIEIVENDIAYGIDVRKGHKTGFYIDQRESRFFARGVAEAFVANTGRAPRALNCFCYTGGFSLALIKGGATEVIGVDSSAEALTNAQQNATRNAMQDKAVFVEDDVFAYLKRAKAEGEKFDIIVLDPPKFASSHHQVERAARAYKEINLKALALLNPGGTLLTFSCSGAIDVALFQKIVAGAVIDSGRDVWMSARLGAGSDHPLLMTCPESEYLKGLCLTVQ
ncbi:MAG TPA: 23S rRNA (cytosine(1962)-C(5))-methyltransferase RlmI [Sutterella sp.]|nr:23S rRNA (cytosine(1962)-C(5))-methyltransferase RlmI [Sutterella sp.]